MKRLKLKDKDKLLSQGYQEILSKETVVDIMSKIRKSCTKKIVMLFNEQIKEMKFLKLEITITTNVKKEKLFEMTLEEIQSIVEKEHPLIKAINDIEQYKKLNCELPLITSNNIKPKI